MKDRVIEKEFALLAGEFALDSAILRSVILSYFDSFDLQARKLPFNNPRTIYTKERFSDYESVWNIPHIGRIGPLYSRYLQWRVNESKRLEMAHRSDYQVVYTQEQIESLAYQVLHDWKEGDQKIGKPEKKQTYPFKRVWLIGKDGKKQARQVIPNKKDVQD